MNQASQGEPAPGGTVKHHRSVRVLTQAAWFEEGKRRFGGDIRQWKFVCPSCKTVQTIQELKDLGLSTDEIHGVMAYSCIGRFTSAKGCDWSLGGFLRIHGLEVVIAETGYNRPTFEFAGGVEEQREVAAAGRDAQ